MSHVQHPSRRPVRRLALVRLLVLSGAEAIFVVRAFDIFDRTGSALWVSGLLFAFFGGMALGGPLSGVLGDRIDRRRLLVASGVAQAAIFATLIVIHLPAAVVAVTFVGAVAASPYNTALPAAVPNLAAPADLAWANGLVNASMNAGIVMGPAMGGVLFDVAGPGAAFAAAVALILAGTALIVTISEPFSSPDTAVSTERGGFMVGVAHVRADPVLGAIVLAWVVMTAGIGTVLVAEVPLAASFDLGAVGYSLIAIAWGVGSVTGSLLGRHIPLRFEARTVLGGITGLAAALLAIAAAPALVPVMIALFAGGLADAAGEVAAQSLFQRRSPDHVRARALAVLNTAGIGGLALSLIFAGSLLDLIGISWSYALAAAAALGAAAVVARVILRERVLDAAPVTETV